MFDFARCREINAAPFMEIWCRGGKHELQKEERA